MFFTSSRNYRRFLVVLDYSCSIKGVSPFALHLTNLTNSDGLLMDHGLTQNVTCVKLSVEIIKNSMFSGRSSISQTGRGRSGNPGIWGENLLLPPANEVWGKVMFLQASVILSTGRWGKIYIQRGRVCIQEGICIQGVGGKTPQWILRDTVNERTVRILLECILV